MSLAEPDDLSNLSSTPPDDATESSEAPRRPPPPRRNLRVLGAAVVLAILAHVLTDGAGAGLNVALIVVALVGTVFGLARGFVPSVTPEARLLLGAAALVGLLFVWRQSTLLGVVNVAALLVTLGLGLASLRAPGLASGGVVRYLLSLVASGSSAALGGVLLPAAMPWGDLVSSRRSLQLGPALRGVLLATPVVLLFGALLGSADAAFARLTGELLRFDVDWLADDLLSVVWWGWLLGGALFVALLGSAWHAAPLSRTTPTLGQTEIGVVLGSVAVLFAAFLGVQFTYLFGGSAQVTSLTGLTYAEYARRGFFELVTVAALVLPLLLGAYGLLPASHRHGPMFRTLSTLVVVLVGMMLISAVRRMLLYVDAYGLTEDRLLTVVFMTWVGLTLAWFVVTVWRDLYARFAFVALLTGVTLVIGLNVLSPGRFIANVNLGRLAAERDVDAVHLTTLGPDAVPVLLEALNRLTDEQRALVRANLSQQYLWREHDWRAWNVSHARARRMLAARWPSETRLP